MLAMGPESRSTEAAPMGRVKHQSLELLSVEGSLRYVVDGNLPSESKLMREPLTVTACASVLIKRVSPLLKVSR